MHYAFLIAGLVLLVLAFWFVVQLVRCLFSSRIRALVRKRWLLHTFWGLFSVGYFGFAVSSAVIDIHYTARAKVQEGLNLGAAAKMGVNEHWAERGAFPQSNAEAGVAPANELSGTYVESVTVSEGGEILVRYTDDEVLPKDARGRTIRFVPTPRDGGLRWDCTGGDVPAELRSPSCQ